MDFMSFGCILGRRSAFLVLIVLRSRTCRSPNAEPLWFALWCMLKYLSNIRQQKVFTTQNTGFPVVCFFGKFLMVLGSVVCGGCSIFSHLNMDCSSAVAEAPGLERWRPAKAPSQRRFVHDRRLGLIRPTARHQRGSLGLKQRTPSEKHA